MAAKDVLISAFQASRLTRVSTAGGAWMSTRRPQKPTKIPRKLHESPRKLHPSSELWAPLSCILLRAAWQSLAECQPTPTVARPRNSSTPVRLDTNDTPSEARPFLGQPTKTRSPQRTPQRPGLHRPGRPPTRNSLGPGPLLSRCPPQGRHLPDGLV